MILDLENKKRYVEGDYLVRFDDLKQRRRGKVIHKILIEDFYTCVRRVYAKDGMILAEKRCKNGCLHWCAKAEVVCNGGQIKAKNNLDDELKSIERQRFRRKIKSVKLDSLTVQEKDLIKNKADLSGCSVGFKELKDGTLVFGGEKILKTILADII